MKTFEFEGKRYRALPSHQEYDCPGCAFREAGPCGEANKAAICAGVGRCTADDIIYILADDRPTPYAWAVTGCSQLFTGEYAEHDAKAWQKHVGGNTEAFPLYRIKENEK